MRRRALLAASKSNEVISIFPITLIYGEFDQTVFDSIVNYIHAINDGPHETIYLNSGDVTIIHKGENVEINYMELSTLESGITLIRMYVSALNMYYLYEDGSWVHYNDD